ncbi:uncharacterized protein PHACADRAFT_170949 [Phanerochaete carnosa HHB-10118-sp]|uniref:Uncharacterized protein n=1 Tax=Phanerochaete carnosa (strain HHB-10118-sp) TaxID=650164 RepID=K5WF77_PHACS|nr:uncharacterized protein PHACADRAFT_170949 [Phanerochaete carnosa HHB-10118-sp]EKM57739.1 hypothetical protein PHACADRAFT_170949 [Phanerochaete carnosa HHB-10118-sp]
MASRYGKRWFGLTQELCLWAVHGLICCVPALTCRQIFEIVQSRPVMLDLLLDIAMVPRPAFYPETTADQIAAEILAIILQLPLGSIPGLEIPLQDAMKASFDDEWHATISVAGLLLERPQWLPKLLKIWKRLDKERFSELQE